MIELSTIKKNKVSLSDYNYRRDVENRLVLASFSTTDFAVMEEILFSPLKTSVRRVAKNIDAQEAAAQESLAKIAATGLIKIEDDAICIDKEMRKYFETEVVKFDSDFKPDMEYLQTLLKKVPIQVLPLWYAIPRTSNNIFDSLLEKYLATPQIFQRYLLEIQFPDPVIAAMAQDVFRAPNFKLTAKALMDKYNLSHETFEEYVLQLEFHFVCALSYEKKGDRWIEVVTPYKEWLDYLLFFRDTTISPVKDLSKIERYRPDDFSFLQDITAILMLLKKQPLTLNAKGYEQLASKYAGLENSQDYTERLILKMKLLRLTEVKEGALSVLPNAADWLEMRPENRAIFLYRHTQNKITSVELPAQLTTERVMREAERSISRVIHSGWILFDHFIKGVSVSLTDQKTGVLTKTGKSWRYALPQYSQQEMIFLKAIVFEWLFEAGITAIGTYEGHDCFSVTAFGQSLFG